MAFTPPQPMPSQNIGAPTPQLAAPRPVMGTRAPVPVAPQQQMQPPRTITTAPGQSLQDAIRARTSQLPQQVMQPNPPRPIMGMPSRAPNVPPMPSPLTGPPGRMPPNLQGGTAPMPMPMPMPSKLPPLDVSQDQAGLRQMVGAPTPQLQPGRPIPGGLPPAKTQLSVNPSTFKKGGSVKSVESSQKQGDKINLSHSKVSTHQRNPKQPKW